jgi:dUTP pyrophosphatase
MFKKITNKAKEDKMTKTNDNVYTLTVQFAKTRKDAIIPSYADKDAAGMDVYIPGSDFYNFPGNSANVINTGIIAVPPLGYHLEMVLRSGVASKKPGMMLGNSIGIIDSNYCGPLDELKIILVNTSPNSYQFEGGQRICQLILRENLHPEIEEISIQDVVNRNRGGLGSTGK